MTTKAKQLVVISGKGGTGKTTIVAALAALAAGTVIIADCDVDAPDLHLVLNPMSPELRKESFRAGKEAGIAAEKCNGCGLCAQYCRFGAIHAIKPARSVGSTGSVDLVRPLASTDAADAADTAFLPTAPPAQVKYAVDPLACEGCGLCARVCPQKAVEMFEPERGAWFISDTPYGPLVHAQLSIGGENSGRLVTIVRNEANRLAAEEGQALILIDGPPGVGCPVIASVTGTDLVLAVTEPTVSGLHDLERVASLAKGFGLPVVVCINKADLNPEMAEAILRFCGDAGLVMAGTLPYDPTVVRAQAQGTTVMVHKESPIAQAIESLWHTVKTMLVDSKE